MPTIEVTTLAVDDHRQFRETLRDLVGATDGFRLVGLAASGGEAVSAVERLAPRLVVMDVRMPGMDGIEATRTMLSRRQGLVVVLISIDDPSSFSGTNRFGTSVAFARKQELNPNLLKKLWQQLHGV